MRFGIVTGYFAIMTARFGNYPKSVTIDRNDRSRFPEIIGHVPPKRPVTIDRNTHVRALSEKDRRVRRIGITKEGREAALSALDAWKLAQSTAEEVLARTGLKF